MFNPIGRWPTRGPLSLRYRKILFSSCISTHYKISTLGYIFTYSPVACALTWAFGLYLLQGLIYPVLDPAFFQPYQTWLAVIIIFVAEGFVGTVVARHRAKDANLLEAASEHLKWTPLTVLFFGGLSYHVFTATMSFFFSIKVAFAATSKDVEDSNFFLEVPAIIRKHWRHLLVNFFIMGIIVALGLDFIPIEWQITEFATMWTIAFIAGCHLIFDIALNPALLRFSF
jgi:hypothetical protein